MAEETEAVRVDRNKREIEQRQRQSWGGKRVVFPHGSSLPAVTADVEESEVFILNKVGAADQMYIFDKGVNNWVTVGPG